VVVAKAGLDLVAGIALIWTGKLPQGFMFLTFVPVDLATLWISL
jgi:hypothetical protein